MRPRIVTLYGGVGSERDVSIVSGKAVMAALEQDKNVHVKGILLDQNKLPEGLDAQRDVVLLVLHGEYGEDGQIQSELENLNVEYCGCDAASSRLCMNKEQTKQVLMEQGIPVVRGVVWRQGCGITVHDLIDLLGTKIIAKPVGMGSSVGLTTITGERGLVAFLDQVNGEDWILEQRIFGREFSIGILNGEAMGVVEIIVPDGRIYDYEQKYHRNDTCYECPAALTDHDTKLVQHLAEKVFQACGCRDYARIDFLRDAISGEWFCLELNTIPGMTPSSLLPKSANHAGLDFCALIDQMLKPAISRFCRSHT